MKFKTNKISDIRGHYLDELKELYPDREAGNFLDMIFEEYFALSRIDRQLNPDHRLSESELLKVHFTVKKLKKFIPIQYIFGKAHFFGLELFVDENVLIPRPETEELVQWIVDDCSEDGAGMRILDIGTGSACIAISLKKAMPLAEVWAMDISKEALLVAHKNAEHNHVKVNFIHDDILKKDVVVQGLSKFDLIVSNPPYVRESEKLGISKNVKDHEPAGALFVNDDEPLVFYRQIAKVAMISLNPRGKLFFEINQYLADDTMKLLHETGFEETMLRKDMNGNDRMIKCSKK